jgi:type I restriction enzyme S subunit
MLKNRKIAELNAEYLLKHFDRIAEAPDAVPRLRRFILDLAVRGKLVEQDPGDEPAAELLKRIQAEKVKLVQDGKIKEQKKTGPVSADEVPFALPRRWSNTRLAAISVCLDYMREPVNGNERDKRIEGKAVFELIPYFGATQQQGWIDDYIFDEELVLLGEDGVPFFDILRPKAYVISGKSWVNNHAHVFRGTLVSNQFLAHWLNTFDYAGRVVGATRSKLNQARALDIPISLPPLAEQRRIVAKVDELMVLCDRLAAAQNKREQRRDRLVSASLHQLQNEEGLTPRRQDAKEEKEVDEKTLGVLASWREPVFLQDMPRLTTRPEHIMALRRTILNLAVRGRLVQQDSNDEPARRFLADLRADRAQIGERLGLRIQSTLAESDLTVCLFAIPVSWRWTCLDECFLVTGGIQKTPKRIPRTNAFSYVGVANVYRGRLDLSQLKQFELLDGELERLRLEVDDILVVEGNGTASEIGRCARWNGEIIDCIHQNHIIRCRPANPAISRFTELYLNSEIGVEVMKQLAVTSAGLYNLSVGKIRRIRLPLPPLAEQHRIVAKVDELMAVCDQLEANLTTTQTDSRRLLEAVLRDALAPALEAAACRIQ